MKAQATIEFAVMIMFAMVVMAILLIIVSHYTLIISQQRSQVKANNLADLVQRELLMAASVPDGYERTLILPDQIGPYTYTVDISGPILIISLSNNQVANRYIPQVTGTFNTGENTIQKSLGQIMVS